MISKVLVANRGEIARRIFRTCRAMGIATVAVSSTPDLGEPHAVEADECVELEGSTPAETYLDIDLVLAAAKKTGADAIHPGYGFLAENAEFASRVTEAGLVWIGPSPHAIEVMGSKLASKQLMTQSGVPTLPTVEITDETDVEGEASEIGYPVLVKASAGGGGKGMRVVKTVEELGDAVAGAQREAEASFGDGTVFLEKYLEAPRHIEIQVFGDSHGNVISLHERECSIQRRHQKIVEEAPSPAIDDSTRKAMGEAAVNAAKAVDYEGAGTVEFLYQDGGFFFLEMNTRLQVEHPVTEMITGLDLVRLQIDVATGGTVPEVPAIDGHAIEVRLYAEDPANDFLPVTGDFYRFEFESVDGLRVDAGVESGSAVSVFYDPMIAKVIAHGPDRATAAATLARALRTSRIHGSTTNLALLVRILESEEYLRGETDTAFLERNDVETMSQPLIGPDAERMAAHSAAIADQLFERQTARVLGSIPSGWRNLEFQRQHRAYDGPSGRHDIDYSAGDIAQFEISQYGSLRYADSDTGTIRLESVSRFPDRDLEDDVGSLHAPMPGKVIKVSASVGDTVAEGEVLVVLEAMKMEHTLRAPHAGTVSQVYCSDGEQVESDAVLVVVEEA